MPKYAPPTNQSDSINACGPMLLFGGEIFEKGEKSLAYLHNPDRLMVYSLLKLMSLATITVYLLLLMRSVRKRGSLKELFTYWQKNSVFYFLREINLDKFTQNIESLESSLTAFEKVRKKSHSNSKQRNLKKIKKKDNHFYICDFHECFCSCCSEVWLNFYENTFVNRITNFKRRLETLLIKNGDKIFFVSCCIMPFISVPLTLLVPFLFLNNCFGNTDATRFIYMLFDFLDGSLKFFNYVFIISFLGTKAELMAIGPETKDQRGIIIYYHCKKALLFCGLLFLLKFSLTVFLQVTIFELSYSEITNVLWIVKCLFLLLFSHYNHAKETIPISENDAVLKSHNRFFAYQNSLLKYMPGHKKVFDIIVKFSKKNRLTLNALRGPEETETKPGSIYIEESIKEEIKANIKASCKRADALLVNELDVVEKQLFKNIRKNNGSTPQYPHFLLGYILFVDIPLYLIVSTVSLFTYSLQFTYWLAFVLYTLELWLFPWLNFTSLMRKILFGDEEVDRLLKSMNVPWDEIRVYSPDAGVSTKKNSNFLACDESAEKNGILSSNDISYVD